MCEEYIGWMTRKYRTEDMTQGYVPAGGGGIQGGMERHGWVMVGNWWKGLERT
jgi:hypothetical protein